MTTLTVNTRELQDALTALTPFLVKPSATHADRVEKGEFLLCTVTATGRLLLTAYHYREHWAMATVALEDFEGETTDFAIRREDLGVCAAAFPKPRADDSLSITVEHISYESKALQGDKLVTEYKRDTRIRMDEVGQLFGARSAQFAGADARAHPAAEMWAHAEDRLRRAKGTEPHFFSLKPLRCFAQAANIYGTMVAAYSGDVLIARARNFVGCAPLPFKPESFVAPPPTKGWADFLADEISLAPDHTVYAA